MRKPPYLGLAIAAGIILLISIVALRRYMPYVGSTLAPKTPPAIVLEMRNAYFVGLNHRKKAWSVRAEKVQIERDRIITTLTGVTDGRIFDQGKVALQMEAGRARYNSVIGDLTMDRGIRLSGSDRQKLTAEGANWNSATSTLRSHGVVRYESPWGRASTKELLVDMRTKEMTMRDVDIKISLSPQEAGRHAL